MADDKDSSTKAKRSVRPVLIVDEKTMEEFSESLRHLLVGLATEAHQPALVCPLDCNAESIISPSVEMIHYPMFKFPLFFRQNKVALIDKVSEFKPTILHCFCTKRVTITRELSEQLDVPYIVTFNSFQKKLFNPKISQTNCTKLVASSVAVAKQLRKAYPGFVDNVAQINVGTFVEDDCVCFSEVDRMPSMVIAQPLSDAVYFESLLNAVRHLAIDGYEFALAIIGRGPASRKIHEMITGLGLSQVVTVVEEIHPLRDIFAGADIYIQPQPSVDISSHLLEAISVGMVVAMCEDSVEDFLVEDMSAVFFDPHDEFSIYSCLQKLLDSRDFAREVATGGQEYLRKNHTVSNMIERLIKIYTEAQELYAPIEE